MKTRFKRGAVRASVAAGVWLAAWMAHGEIGPALTGLSGNANDATTAFASPAGITRLDQSEIVLQSSLLYTESEFEVDRATVAGGDGKRDRSVNLIPGIFYVRPLNERWWFGASLNIPSGIGYDFGKYWAGRYHMQETQLAFLAGTATLAYKLTDQLSLSAGPYMMYVDSKSTARVNNVLPEYADGRVQLDESGADLGYMLGAMYEFSDSTRVAASYHSELQPDLEGTPSFRNIDPALRVALAAADLLGTEVDVDFTVPAIAMVGFYNEFSDHWSMTGDLVWLDMSEFGITHIRVEQDSVSVKSKFKDMWVTSVGLKYRYGEDRAVSAGGLYASSGVSDKNRDIGMPIDRIIGAGLGYAMPVKNYFMHVNLNYFDLGDGDVDQQGGALTGDFSGSFNRNWSVMLDFQFRKRL
jgi:long-chain fatty acid transport protein